MTCQHCEAHPANPRLGGLLLCPACYRRPGLRDLYRMTATESPLWTAHLLSLRRLAEQGQPLGRTSRPLFVSHPSPEHTHEYETEQQADA